MKNFLMLSVLVLGVSVAAPAFAEEGDMKGGGGHHGKGHGMFKMADTDGDGFISRAEFDIMHAKKFKMIDANSDGKVSKEEAKAHHKAKREKRKEKQEERHESHDEH